MFSADLLERTEELGTLARLCAPASGFVLIEGPAGIGKTRLLSACGEMAAAAGVRVLTGRCSELEQAFTFGLVRQLFEPALAAAPEARPEWLSGAAAAAAPIFDLSAPSTDTGDFALHYGLYWMAAAMARPKPLMLLIDDLQWADMASLRFLAHLQLRLDGLPVLVVCAQRTGTTDAERARLLNVLATSLSCETVRPKPLTATAVEQILTAALSRKPEPAFAAACHRVTGGNPLLTDALVRVVAAEGLEPTAANRDRAEELGSRAVARHVAVRMARCSPSAVRLVRATAVLGDGADLSTAAQLAGIDVITAAGCLDELLRESLLRTEPGPASGPDRLATPHPLVRSAVYAALPPGERILGHQQAVSMLGAAGADPELIAAHLLRIPPDGSPTTAAALQAAALAALSRGSPDSAQVYLRRCLSEPLPADIRDTVLTDLAHATRKTNAEGAVEYFRVAASSTTEPAVHAKLMSHVGATLAMLDRPAAAIEACRESIALLPPEDTDLRRRSAAGLVLVRLMTAEQPDLVAQSEQMCELPPDTSLGGRFLDCMLSLHEAYLGRPEAVARARRGLTALSHGGAAPEIAAFGAWPTLLAADVPDIMQRIDLDARHIQARGSATGMYGVATYRMIGWLNRGDLAEAEANGLLAREYAATTGFAVGHTLLGYYLTTVYLEQGATDRARANLDWACTDIGREVSDMPGPAFYPLCAQAALLRAEGDPDASVRAALAAGRRYIATGGENPAFAPWRSEAALSLSATGDLASARRYALAEVTAAGRWTAARPLGRALRVAGMVHGGEAAAEFLTRAVEVLRDSAARLEFARAAYALGALHRRTNQNAQARGPLRQALEIAEQCGARKLADLARTDLRAAGGRTRPTALSGPAALTPSEGRIAELAAQGRSNREIAQALFVTAKTVEVHLSSVYRKLGVKNRAEMAKMLE